MIDFDPFALADRQIAIDRSFTAQMPVLFDRKRARAAPSPHAFLRGSATLFHEILAARPALAAGPPAAGFILGDMHLENVGAYRNDAGEVVFALNDFDDASIAPLHLDVLRLSTSVILAGRGFRATGAQSIALAERLVGAYTKATAGAPAPAEPEVVRDLVARSRDRNKKALLDARAPEGAHGKRRFTRGDRYLDLPPDIEARAPELLSAYISALGERAPNKAAAWRVEDAAIRVAGNGSLGVLRVAMLVRDHDGDDRLVELKECRPTSVNAVAPLPAGRFANDADRVVAAARALLPAPPRHLAALTFEGRAFVGRRLFPQEDKLALDTMHTGAALDDLVQLIGHLVGAAHARGLTALGAARPAAWTSAEATAILDHAVTLAGLLEATYLAWVRRAG